MRNQIYLLNNAKPEHLLIKYKPFFGPAHALLPQSPQKVLYLIKKSKKEQIQLKRRLNYGKRSDNKVLRGGGKVI